MDNMPDNNPRDLQDYYDRGYHNVIHRGMMEDEVYYQTRSKAYARLYFLPEERTARILDYGCGLGQTVASLANPHGYDASEEARGIAKAHGLSVYDSAEQIPKESFDIVICRHALEHVPNPLATLTQIKSYIRPGGKLILVLPKEHHYESSFSPDINMHLFAWNFRSINNLLSIAGFTVTSNKSLYNLGYRRLLPLAKLNFRLYELATIAAGRWYKNGELVIHANVSK